MVQYSFTSTETEGSLGRTAQDSHLDSHTAPELWQNSNNDCLFYACFKVQYPNVAGVLEEMLEFIVRRDASSTTVISALSLVGL